MIYKIDSAYTRHQQDDRSLVLEIFYFDVCNELPCNSFFLFCFLFSMYLCMVLWLCRNV